MKANFYPFCFLISLLLGGSAILNPAFTQFATFSPKNDLLNPGEFNSGISVAISDMNDDGYDDLVVLDQGRRLNLQLQQADGSAFQHFELDQVSNSSQWSMCVGDVDNNGYSDILTGGNYDGIKLSKADDQGVVYSTQLLPGPTLFAQASNMADINNDGHLDIFVCHDDAESRIWGNDGMGNFVEADDWIDMATIPASDNSGNYGSIWSDFDHDGDLDLYIAKCRQSVASEDDPRRINALFVNDGNGNYTEDAASYGLKIGAQSWTADFQDIDNDGDFDCFITNHDRNNQILENDGSGHFTDITEGSGMEESDFPLQGVMRDFDNDGYVDILIAGDKMYCYRNNGDKTFTLVEDPVLGSDDIHSYAIGDLNHDGFLDIYASYARNYTTPSNKDDILWLNNGNDNNFLVVDLQGTMSNRDAVGAKVKLYGPWGIQIREVRAGESYGIHNSFFQHFGLGTHTSIDSVVVEWPSGLRDQIVGPAVNQFIEIIENTCASPDASLELSGSPSFCDGDSLVLTAPDGYTYQWSNGATSRSIVVYDSGNFNVTVSDGGPCEGISANVAVEVDPDETPEISLNQDLINCPGTVVTLTASPANGYLWSNGDTTRVIEVDQAGDYWVEIRGTCRNFTSASVSLDYFDVPLPEVTPDTVINMGSGTLLADGQNISWYETETAPDPIAFGPEYTTPILDTTTVYWVEDIVVFADPPARGGKTEASDGGSYNDSGFQGLNLQLDEPTRILSALVYAESAGERNIRFFDRQNADDLGSVSVMIPEGESRITIDKALPQSSEVYMFIGNNAGLYHDEDPSVIEFPLPTR